MKKRIKNKKKKFMTDCEKIEQIDKKSFLVYNNCKRKTNGSNV
jgi:hypothetical protein